MPDWLILLGLFIFWSGTALVGHALDVRYFFVSLYTSVIMVVATQIVNYLEIGKVDPLWFISAITSFFLGFILSLLIGLPFRFSRVMSNDG